MSGMGGGGWWVSGLGVSGLRGIRPPPQMATAAVGTHPTGMHSCMYGFRERGVGILPSHL